MLDASHDRILAELDDEDVVLDVGGWAKPFARADWVIDLMPYETRGLYGDPDPDLERFDASRWVSTDICDHEPWPFADDQFDFAICSHTLEDLRDPIWVCHELNRVARAGYIEVPSRVHEQAIGVEGPWPGRSHHRWLIDVSPTGIEFVAKPGVLFARREMQVARTATRELGQTEKVQTLFWNGGFDYSERFIFEVEELDTYVREAVDGLPNPPPPSRIGSAIRSVMRRR